MDGVAWAVIGGSGLYQLPGLLGAERRTINTPYGAPSAACVVGSIGTQRVVFLARHGEQHHLAPHKVNYRANIWALKQLGVRAILAVNSVGGIRADMAPRALALPDQLIDYTHGRVASFGDDDGATVLHAPFAEPYSAQLRGRVLAAARASETPLIDGGCYGVTQGPRLETCAEIERLRRDGCDMVGMTGMPEAALARELEIDYACVAVVGNWAAGCGDDAPITLAEVAANVAAAGGGISQLLAETIG